MGELIDLLEYKRSKEESEIQRLQRELASLIKDMGGIHIAPMMMLTHSPLLFPITPEAYTPEIIDDQQEGLALLDHDNKVWSTVAIPATDWSLVEYASNDKKE